MASFKKIKKETVSSSIINQITDLIKQQELKLGDRLPSERALAELMGVSRPPVREALHTLIGLGLIEVRSGEGTFLSKNPEIVTKHLQLKHLVSSYDIRDLVEARRILETQVVGLAVTRMTPDIQDRLLDTIEKCKSSMGDPDYFLETDFEFHLLISQASHNRVLEEMMWTTRDMLLDVNKVIIRRPGQLDLAIAHHQAIVDAILEGNVGKAQEWMSVHLDSVLSSLEYALAKVQGDENKNPSQIFKNI
ncbi:MAG: FadR family transcriptional regulator [Deltaproteobacteria bacterium]|nr:FadR family transcriptional regulator [Deltaproteobacteria bacterium]